MNDPAAGTGPVQHHYRPILFDCPRPTCRAEPGGWCRSTGGYNVPFHAGRCAAADAASEEEITRATTALRARRKAARDMVTNMVAARHTPPGGTP